MKTVTITTCPTNKIIQKIELKISGEPPVWFGYLYFNKERHTLVVDDERKFRIEKTKD